MQGSPKSRAIITDARRLLAVLLVACAWQAHAQVLDCATDLYPGMSLVTHERWGKLYADGAAPCTEDTTHRAALRAALGVDVRIFVPDNWSRSWHPGVPRDIVTWIADATRQTMLKLQPVLEPMDINVVLLEGLSDDFDADGNILPMSFDLWGTTASELKPCLISIPIIGIVARGTSTTAGSRDERDVKSLIAHELFHCYQNEHFEDQLVADDAILWWMEGTPEHIANEVYPCNRTSREWAAEYNAGATPIEQDYANVLFFNYLASRQGFGIQQLEDFIRSMPTSRGVAAQRRALAEWPGMDAQWHAFARAIADYDFPDCIASTLSTVAPNTEIRASQVLTRSAQPFTVELFRLTFTEDATYEVRITDPAGSRPTGLRRPNRVSYRVGDTWHDADVNGEPFRFETACNEKPEYLFAVTSATAETTPYEMSIDVTRRTQPLSTCCPETQQHDQCVVGAWALDKDAMLVHLSEINRGVTWSEPEGELRTEFGANGRVRGARANLLFRGVIELNNGTQAPFSVSIQGRGTGVWSTEIAEEGRLLHTCPETGGSEARSEVNFPGLPPNSQPFTPDRALGGLSLRYTCERDQLVIFLPGGRMKQVWRREP